MCTIIEEWRDIAGYEGIYQVSNLGQVKSLNYNRTGKEKILRHSMGRGYLKVDLCKNGKHHQCRIHRLVAEAFIQNSDNLPQVNHKDENKENNRVDNLEWCSSKYNANYGTRNERTAKKNSKQVLCVETGVIYSSFAEAFRQTGASSGNINECCRGKRNTAGGYHWKYSD